MSRDRLKYGMALSPNAFLCAAISIFPCRCESGGPFLVLLLMFRAALPVLCQTLQLWLCLHCISKFVFTTIKAHSFENSVWNSILEKLVLIFNLLRSSLRAQCPSTQGCMACLNLCSCLIGYWAVFNVHSERTLKGNAQPRRLLHPGGRYLSSDWGSWDTAGNSLGISLLQV